MRQTKEVQPYKPPANCYQGDELKPNPGMPPERLYAFTLPSRNGKWLHYPDGRRVLFPVASQ